MNHARMPQISIILPADNVLIHCLIFGNIELKYTFFWTITFQGKSSASELTNQPEAHNILWLIFNVTVQRIYPPRFSKFFALLCNV